ncbi:endonuclease domain-containing protein [Frankia sp. AiPa1]|uniref:endonuclease domain-containing protein n=1 Tax=Frankia sp. AiPa1 TaxID=573492 RepID=UPI00202ADA33|nr:DUF559 domain-containing protein [Frankia sp. AiPa1]MCL9762856.1 endonuclease domain-containing protein [Frankia sp. AiPa1]
MTALARQQDDVVTRVQALTFGMTPDAIRTLRQRHGWGSPIRGAMFVPPVRNELRAHARAASTVLGGTICGLTAARLHGLPGLPERLPGEPVDLAFPDADQERRRRGYRRHRSSFEPWEVTDHAGIPTSSLRRTLEDVAVMHDRETFITTMDATLHARRITPADVAEMRRRVWCRRGGGTTRTWWPLIDGKAESPLESRIRLVLCDAGLPPGETQWPVRDPVTGNEVARLDFAWPSLQVAIEADGVGPHGQPAALYRDRRRQNDLVRLGWEILRFTWRDAISDAERLTEIVRAVLRDAEARAVRGSGGSAGSMRWP